MKTSPPKMKDAEDYENWKLLIQMWETVTDLEAEKRAAAVILTLDGKSQQAALELEPAKISSKEGIKNLVEKLDTLFAVNKDQVLFRTYENFESYKRKDHQTVKEYIIQFERNQNQLEKLKVKLPDVILAYRLLKGANLGEENNKLVRATCKELTLGEMKEAIGRVYDQQLVKEKEEFKEEFKEEPTFESTHEEKEEECDTYYNERGRRGYRSRSNRFRNRSSYNSRGDNRRQYNPSRPNPYKPGSNQRMTCFKCNSIWHFSKDCKEKTEEVHITLMAIHSYDGQELEFDTKLIENDEIQYEVEEEEDKRAEEDIVLIEDRSTAEYEEPQIKEVKKSLITESNGSFKDKVVEKLVKLKKFLICGDYENITIDMKNKKSVELKLANYSETSENIEPKKYNREQLLKYKENQYEVPSDIKNYEVINEIRKQKKQNEENFQITNDFMKHKNTSSVDKSEDNQRGTHDMRFDAYHKADTEDNAQYVGIRKNSISGEPYGKITRWSDRTEVENKRMINSDENTSRGDDERKDDKRSGELKKLKNGKREDSKDSKDFNKSGRRIKEVEDDVWREDRRDREDDNRSGRRIRDEDNFVKNGKREDRRDSKDFNKSGRRIKDEDNFKDERNSYKERISKHGKENHDLREKDLSGTENEEGNKDENLYYTNNDNQELMRETINKAILDSGCTKTVCGNNWLKCYRETLNESENDNIKLLESSSSFKFGDGNVVKSVGKVFIPIELSGKKVKLATEVINKNLPLLLSRESMKKAKTVINFHDGTCYMFGNKQNLQMTSNGHFCVPLNKTSFDREGNTSHMILFNDKLENKNESERMRIAKKLHQQFAHANSNRLIKLLKDGGVKDKDFHKMIVKVEEKCEICSKFKKAPSLPTVCFPRASEFNQHIAIDLKHFPPLYMLHTIDHFTRFSRASVIKSTKAEVIVEGILKEWISIFGSPGKILSDNGPEFNNNELRECCEKFNITVTCTAAESPWSNGVNERHNGIIGQMVKKMLEDGHDLEKAVVWATSAKNSLSNVQGYSPNQLVFGRNTNFPNLLNNKPPAMEPCDYNNYLFKNLKAMKAARKTFIHHEACDKLNRAFNRKTRTQITSLNFNIGERVYYQRDDKWKGPGIIVSKEEKNVIVKHGGQSYKVHPCRIVRVNEEEQNEEEQNELEESNTLNQQKESEYNTQQERAPVMESESEEETDNGQDLTEEVDVNSNLAVRPQWEQVDQMEQDDSNNINVLSSTFGNENGIIDNLLNYKEPDNKSIVECKKFNDDGWKKIRILGRAGKVLGKNARWFNVQNMEEPHEKGSINWEAVEKWKKVEEEVLLNSNQEDVEIVQAKMKELENWKELEVYEEVENKNQEYITTRWIVTEKSSEDLRKVKARLVARGFQEDSSDLRKDSPTLSRESMRIMICIAISNGWKVNSIDIKSAFLQGQKLNRSVHIKPPKEANTDKYWKLNKCVYGLTDASRKWYLTLNEELEAGGLEMIILDEAFYVWRREDTVEGIIGIHVDDIFWTGTNRFKKHIIEKIKKRFSISSEKYDNFQYLGLNIKQEDDYISIDQEHYIKEIEKPDIDINGKKKNEPLNEDEKLVFKRYIGQLNWISSLTHPDLAYETCEASVGYTRATIDDIFKANKTLRKLNCSELKMKFVPMKKMEECKIVVFTDASHAKLKGSESQGGYIIFLVDQNNRANPIKWQSKKISRIVKSTIAAECLSLLEGIENAFCLKRFLELIYKHKNKFDIFCYTDNKSLVENIYSSRTVNDSRLKIDIACLRQMINRKEINKIEWIPREKQLADVFTKGGSCGTNLVKAINTNFLDC